MAFVVKLICDNCGSEFQSKHRDLSTPHLLLQEAVQGGWGGLAGAWMCGKCLDQIKDPEWQAVKDRRVRQASRPT